MTLRERMTERMIELNLLLPGASPEKSAAHDPMTAAFIEHLLDSVEALERRIHRLENIAVTQRTWS